MSEQTTVAELTPQAFNDFNTGNAHEYLGFEVTHVEPGKIVATMVVRPDQLNPMGGLHGGVTASLADSLCGYGVVTTLQNGASSGFTTLGLNANYVSRAGPGDVLVATASLLQGSRKLQTWDVNVTCDDRIVAVVRVTQLILRPDRRDRSAPG
jgi:1,4-dihydroxy-2-naphthoyl-CoA hydrolase